jgi:hypothetical protein
MKKKKRTVFRGKYIPAVKKLQRISAENVALGSEIHHLR